MGLAFIEAEVLDIFSLLGCLKEMHLVIFYCFFVVVVVAVAVVICILSVSTS